MSRFEFEFLVYAL